MKKILFPVSMLTVALCLTPPAALFGLFRKDKSKSIVIESNAFNENNVIPKIHTGVSDNISPDLAWENVPVNAKSIAIICEDPDAPVGIWTHWIIFDIPPTITKLEKNIPAKKIVLDTVKQGRNDFGSIGYRGPMPPPGLYHRYYFKIYALDNMLGIGPGITRDEFLEQIKGHVLAEGNVMGRFKR